MDEQVGPQTVLDPSNMKPSFYSSFTESNPMRRSSSQYMDDLGSDMHPERATEQYWRSLIADSVYFEGHDELFGQIIAMVYQNKTSKKLSCMLLSVHGQTIVDSMSLTRHSKYYPAVENLSRACRKSNVRRALAVAMLRTYAKLDPNTKSLMMKKAQLEPDYDWDETKAGKIASEMKLIDNRTPQEVGEFLLKLGFAQQRKQRTSYVADVIYANTQNLEDSDKNNELAFLLGEQLDHLFDPLTEYSPEPTEKAYKPPADAPQLQNSDDILVKSICNELVKVQTNFTVSLVQFLQKFLIPLRIDVLEGKIPGYTTAKLNQVFPPTIDEVTRINCIYLDILKTALPYGSFEILKASGTTIPYFYKAHMRHEAATKTFATQLDAFLIDMKKIGYDKLAYDQKTIQSIMHASLNLPKLQLILDRLMTTKKWPQVLQPEVDEYYQSCLNTIIAFGSDVLKPYNHRIFTPTGKILTELASGWPAELQYGWLTRRVVAIFDVKNVLKHSVKNNGVLIIFSDHVVILEIVDDLYYYDLFETDVHVHKPSIADVLMHSLVNEVPFSSLPKMRVERWSGISDIDAQFYNYDGKAFIQLFDDKAFDVYEVSKYTGSHVIEVLNKAKILNKSQPFHLFRASDTKQTLYYTAHDLETYKSEETKSPLAVFLNMSFDESYLKKYSLFGFVTLNFSSNKILMEGTSCCENYVRYEVPYGELSIKLLGKIFEMLDYQLTYANPMISQKLCDRSSEMFSRAALVINSSQESQRKELANIKKAHKLFMETRKPAEGHEVHKPRSDSLNMLNSNRVSSTKITKPKDKSVPFYKRIFRGKRGSMAREIRAPGKMSEAEAVPVLKDEDSKRVSETMSSMVAANEYHFPTRHNSILRIGQRQSSRISSIHHDSAKSTARQTSAAETDNLIDGFGLNIDKLRPETLKSESTKETAHGNKPQGAFHSQEVQLNENHKGSSVQDVLKDKLERYFSEVRKRREQHEKNLKEYGVSLVMEGQEAPLGSKGLLFSPSVAAKLNKFNDNEKGDNWIVANNDDNSVLESDKSKESIISRVASFARRPVSSKGWHKHAIVDLRDTKTEKRLPQVPKEFDEVNEAKPESTVILESNSAPGALEAKRPSVRIVTPLQVAHEKFKDQPPIPQIAEDADLFRDIDLSSTFDMSLPDLTDDMEIFDSPHTDKSETEDEKFFTPKEGTAAVFEEQNTTLTEQSNTEVDKTSLCSALEEVQDNTVGKVLVNLWNEKRYMSSSSLYTGILNDESYAYLAPLLAGNTTIDGGVSSGKEQPIDYDAIITRGLKESSLRYLAELLGE
ncbi:hypothetical protein KL933_000360 [Ogataea haglerorum]|uniref:Uncharacterized protein n=1 Tax=Ogataea haglerorum TaxID=1937702 RepID=A0AAN6I2G8_9ASCO|nr:hypothetical protein KL933_000360 [Ogataea haglerorum]KAG7734839.1 hypothetical protein KL948_000405 [Ogataea haglerorum]